MVETIKCRSCRARAYSDSLEGAIETFKCSSCGESTEALVHYVDQFFDLGIDHYHAIIPVANNLAARKAAIKIRKVFRGMSNFREGELLEQISSGQLALNAGIYSECEVQRLAEQAKLAELDVQFVQLPSDSVLQGESPGRTPY